MARSRPVVATVFGVLNVALGGLGVMGWLLTIGRTFPFLARSGWRPAYRLWWVASHCVGLILAGVLVLAGVGLLTLKPWGRWVSIGYPICAIVFVIASAAVNALFLAAYGHVMWGAAAGLARVLAGLLYPVVLLVFMLHPTVAAALKEACAPQPGSAPPA